MGTAFPGDVGHGAQKSCTLVPVLLIHLTSSAVPSVDSWMHTVPVSRFGFLTALCVSGPQLLAQSPCGHWPMLRALAECEGCSALAELLGAGCWSHTCRITESQNGWG